MFRFEPQPHSHKSHRQKPEYCIIIASSPYELIFQFTFTDDQQMLPEVAVLELQRFIIYKFSYFSSASDDRYAHIRRYRLARQR